MSRLKSPAAIAFSSDEWGAYCVHGKPSTIPHAQAGMGWFPAQVFVKENVVEIYYNLFIYKTMQNALNAHVISREAIMAATCEQFDALLKRITETIVLLEQRKALSLFDLRRVCLFSVSKRHLFSFEHGHFSKKKPNSRHKLRTPNLLSWRPQRQTTLRLIQFLCKLFGT